MCMLSMYVCVSVSLQRSGESQAWAADVWSVTCNIVLMITGQHPWEGVDSKEVPYKVCMHTHTCTYTHAHTCTHTHTRTHTHTSTCRHMKCACLCHCQFLFAFLQLRHLVNSHFYDNSGSLICDLIHEGVLKDELHPYQFKAITSLFRQVFLRSSDRRLQAKNIVDRFFHVCRG